MKKVFCLVLLLFSVFMTNVYADSWDNLTKKQAEEVLVELEKNPYILDYCDCCDATGKYAAEVFLLRVDKAEIIPCEWSAGEFSVAVSTTKIAKIKNTDEGLELDDITEYDAVAIPVMNISMNYTYIYNSKLKNASPVHKVVPYSMKGTCKGDTHFPSPKAKKKTLIKNKKYVKWYKSRY